jgi:hypothetical protein
LTLVVLVILAALWAVVLLPPLLRSRTERTNDSIGDFNYRLDVLGKTNGALRVDATRVAPGQRAAKRRRDVMRVLIIAVGVTGLLAVASNMSALWALNVIADVSLLAFFGLWVYSRSLQLEQARKVHRIPAPKPAHAGDLAWRRAASS